MRYFLFYAGCVVGPRYGAPTGAVTEKPDFLQWPRRVVRRCCLPSMPKDHMYPLEHVLQGWSLEPFTILCSHTLLLARFPLPFLDVLPFCCLSLSSPRFLSIFLYSFYPFFQEGLTAQSPAHFPFCEFDPATHKSPICRTAVLRSRPPLPPGLEP